MISISNKCLKIRNIIMALLLFVVVSCDLSEGDKPQVESISVEYCNYKVSDFILEKVVENRIVMLGDSQHGSSKYMRPVVKFLNAWVDSLGQQKQETSIPKRLVLVLEMDSVQVHRVKQFWKTKKIEDLVGLGQFLSPQFTVEVIKFYHDLESIKLRVDKLNRDIKLEDSVFFEIKGAEKLIDIDDWTLSKRDDYFFNERDKYSSQQIIHLLESELNFKVLVYYGSAHLQTTQILKRGMLRQDYGYYLAHYLDEYCKPNNNLFRIQQATVDMVPGLFELCQSDSFPVAIDNLLLKSGRDSIIQRLMSTDASIWHKPTSSSQTSLNKTWSLTTTELMISSLIRLAAFDNDFHRQFKNTIMRYLTIVSGLPIDVHRDIDSVYVYSKLQYWQKWLDTSQIDFVNDIQSLALWKRLINNMETTDLQSSLLHESLLANALGIIAQHDTTLSLEERMNWYRNYLYWNRRELVLGNLINLLWVGRPEEVIYAKKALTHETGEQFQSAKEWSEWWDNKRAS